MTGAPEADGGAGPSIPSPVPRPGTPLRPQRLPAELAALVGQVVGGGVAEVEEITSLPARGGWRRTFRIRSLDGRTWKGRLTRRPEVPARMARWIPLLPAGGFPPLLATAGRASLEGWCEGEAASPGDAAAAGDWLGRVHAALPRESLGAADERLAVWTKDVHAWLETVVGAGHLPPTQAARVRTTVEAGRPAGGTWGLRHGDVGPQNFLRTPRGLCCVDNTTVGPGVLESDLGQALSRWSLAGEGREGFLAGYGRHGDPGEFLRAERFWLLAAALRSAAYRAREGAGDVRVPLDELRRHVP